VGFLTDQDPHVRQAAAAALGEIADPRVASSIAAVTLDADPEVRESALAALHKLAPTGSVAPPSDATTPSTTPEEARETGQHIVQRGSRPHSWRRWTQS
jgi:HEAT repeats